MLNVVESGEIVSEDSAGGTRFALAAWRPSDTDQTGCHRLPRNHGASDENRTNLDINGCSALKSVGALWVQCRLGLSAVERGGSS